MPIKKSYLEQKRHYRVAKVLFWIIPFLAVVIFIFQGAGIDMLQMGIPYAIGYIIGMLQINIVSIATGLALYFLTVKIAWKIFLYIKFGGLEDDMKKKKKDVLVAQPVSPVAQPAPAPAPVQTPTKSSSSGGWFILLVIILFAVYGLSHGGWIKNTHTYGTPCTNSKGVTGLYGTNGSCWTCSKGATAFTSPINSNCSDGTGGVYCCRTGGTSSGTKQSSVSCEYCSDKCPYNKISWTGYNYEKCQYYSNLCDQCNCLNKHAICHFNR